jgi:hypothetical protein
VSTSTVALKKQKSWDRAYYLKKKLHVLQVELAAAAAAAAVAPASVAIAVTAATAVVTAAADPAAAAASSTTAAALAAVAAADPWFVDTNGNVCTPAAQKMMKHQHVKPILWIISSAQEACTRRQLFSVLSRIILPWPLCARLQGSTC